MVKEEMLVESSIAATFVECLKVVSNCSLFPILGAQTSFKAGGCVFSCLECRNYNTPFIWLFFLLNFAFAFKISGNSNLSPHIPWTSNSLHHCQACLPHERLFQGETDGSSFPNGGLRVTHSAAAFTTWDRASPPFVMDKCHLEIGRVMGRPWKPRKFLQLVQLEDM